MNIFICNRYDSKKENIYVISPKFPLDKNNIKVLKNPLVKNLILEEINNINKNSITNINNTNNPNSEESEELQIIDYPYSPVTSNINLGNHFKNKFRYDSSVDYSTSFYNCFDIETVEEKKQIRMNRNNSNIERKKEGYYGNSNIKDKFESKFMLNESQIDVEDTIKGEDNINITKLKSINKNIGFKKNANNIRLISNNLKKKKNYLEKIPLNSTNILKINNDTNENNNTFIKRKPNINIFNKSISKKKKNNNTMKYNTRTKLIPKINPKEFLNSTTKITKNNSKQSNNNFKIINNYDIDDDIFMKKIYQRKISNDKKNINNNITNSKEIIRSIKKKLQKDKIYGINNYDNLKKK